MITYPTPKINIGLHVVEKMSNGYHSLETVFYPINNQHDILEIFPTANSLSLQVFPVGSLSNEIENNLCVKAYRLWEKRYNLPPVEIKLTKNIPTSAGLGGGSSDAAFTLKMLNQLFQLQLSVEQLKADAALLGSDVPFFIENQPAYAYGKGDILEPIALDLSPYHIQLYHSNIHVSTAEAYQWIKPQQPLHPLKETIKLPVSEWKNLIVNDFEEIIFKRYPELQVKKTALYDQGAVYVSMSGSGASIYAIFKN